MPRFLFPIEVLVEAAEGDPDLADADALADEAAEDCAMEAELADAEAETEEFVGITPQACAN